MEMVLDTIKKLYEWDECHIQSSQRRLLGTLPHKHLKFTLSVCFLLVLDQINWSFNKQKYDWIERNGYNFNRNKFNENNEYSEKKSK